MRTALVLGLCLCAIHTYWDALSAAYAKSFSSKVETALSASAGSSGGSSDTPFYPAVDPQDPATWPTLKHLADEGDVTAIDRLHCLWMLHDVFYRGRQYWDHDFYHFLRTRLALGLPTPTTLQERFISFFERYHINEADGIRRRVSAEDYFHPYFRPDNVLISRARDICLPSTMDNFHKTMADGSDTDPALKKLMFFARVGQVTDFQKEPTSKRTALPASLAAYMAQFQNEHRLVGAKAESLRKTLASNPIYSVKLSELIAEDWCNPEPSVASLSLRHMLKDDFQISAGYTRLGHMIYLGRCTAQDRALGLRLMRQGMLDFLFGFSRSSLSRYGHLYDWHPERETLEHSLLGHELAELPPSAGFGSIVKARDNPVLLAKIFVWALQGQLAISEMGELHQAENDLADQYYFSTWQKRDIIVTLYYMSNPNELIELIKFFNNQDIYPYLKSLDDNTYLINFHFFAASRIHSGSLTIFYFSKCLEATITSNSYYGWHDHERYYIPYLLGGAFPQIAATAEKNSPAAAQSHPLDLPGFAVDDPERLEIDRGEWELPFYDLERLPVERCLIGG